MQTSHIVLLSGTILIAIAIVLAVFYEVIEESNSPLYSLENVVIEPQENQIGKVTLHEDKASISVGIKQEGVPVKVIVTNENGEIVGELTSTKKFDVIVFENSFPTEQFTVSTTNMGEQSVNVFVGVSDVKEPGTYIDSPEAWWFLITLSNILGGLGFVVLITGAIMFFGTKRKNKKSVSFEQS